MQFLKIEKSFKNKVSLCKKYCYERSAKFLQNLLDQLHVTDSEKVFYQ